MSITIRRALNTDEGGWSEMRNALWPTHAGGHDEEIARYFREESKTPLDVLLAICESGRAVGFVELNIRPYAEGCYSGRVAYLEGWFVREECPGEGIGAALLSASEQWGRDRGCTEFASDAEIQNEVSISIHTALGFTEVERIACFRKDL